jgi:putative ABC transport system permease protein
LAAIGGVLGVGLGAGITWGFAAARGLPVTVPIEALFGAVGVALLIGTLAGLYPASRAAAIPPSQAVRGT